MISLSSSRTRRALMTCAMLAFGSIGSATHAQQVFTWKNNWA
jgi:hypothetical protein